MGFFCGLLVRFVFLLLIIGMVGLVFGLVRESFRGK